MRISVVGCGYLGGLHTASTAELSHDFIGIDVDRAEIGMLSLGKAPFFEPGFEELLACTLRAGRLRFTGR